MLRIPRSTPRSEVRSRATLLDFETSSSASSSSSSRTCSRKRKKERKGEPSSLLSRPCDIVPLPAYPTPSWYFTRPASCPEVVLLSGPCGYNNVPLLPCPSVFPLPYGSCALYRNYVYPQTKSFRPCVPYSFTIHERRF